MNNLKYVIIEDKQCRKAIIFDNDLSYKIFANEKIISAGFVSFSTIFNGKIKVCCYGTPTEITVKSNSEEDAKLICNTLNLRFENDIFIY